MHDQKIHAGGHGLLERRQAGVDRGADFGDTAAVGDLQAVGGAGEILKNGAARAPVAVGDDLIKRGHASCCNRPDVRMKAKKRGARRRLLRRHRVPPAVLP